MYELRCVSFILQNVEATFSVTNFTRWLWTIKDFRGIYCYDLNDKVASYRNVFENWTKKKQFYIFFFRRVKEKRIYRCEEFFHKKMDLKRYLSVDHIQNDGEE